MSARTQNKTTPAPAEPGKAQPADRGVFLAAVAILVVYLIVIGTGLFVAQTVTDTVWDRQYLLIGGLEALAFTAAGYVFGKEVHRREAAKAEERANQAETQVQQS